LNRIILSAPAKINLFLDVTGKLQNGYHTLDMVMQTISLEDEILLEKTTVGIEISSGNPEVPSGRENICHKAAGAFFEGTARTGGIKITIKKRIPVAAGLGGGSSDAAAVLKGMNILYDTGLTPKELCGIGLQCGADVPYFLTGGTCRARGIGEVLTKLPSFAGVYAVLVMPDFSVSTAWVYQNYRTDDPVRHPDTQTLISAIRARDIHKVARNMKNVLESVTAVKYPEIEGIKRDLKRYGALGSLMSGSGPSVFGLFESGEKAAKAFSELQKTYKQIYLVSTTDGGEEYGEADKNKNR